MDSYIKHNQDDFADALAALFPTGAAWPTDPDSELQRLIYGLAGPWADVADASDLFLTRESDPRQTVIILGDWERNFGLPDPCVAEPLTIDDRHTALVQRMTLLGDQSRAFFIAAALQIGYHIAIEEFSPFQCGISAVGNTQYVIEPSGYYVPGIAFDDALDYRWQIGRPEMRFYWRVHVLDMRLSYFHCASGQCGVDPLLGIALATDLTCLLDRWKPAHTQIVYDYSPVVVS